MPCPSVDDMKPLRPPGNYVQRGVPPKLLRLFMIRLGAEEPPRFAAADVHARAKAPSAWFPDAAGAGRRTASEPVVQARSFGGGSAARRAQ